MAAWLETDAETADDDGYQALQDLRGAVLEDLTRRGARLPRLRTYTPRATMPALCLAYEIHSDAGREDELLRRNAIAHPGFVPGGQPLEVLSV